jgi:hypothetical protein
LRFVRKPKASIFALVVLLFLILALVSMLSLGMFSLIFFVAFAMAGAAIFVASNLVGRTVNCPQVSTLAGKDSSKRRIRLILSILFFCAYSLSFLIITPGSGGKPVAYYLLVSICAGLVVADILSVNSRFDVGLNLAKSVLLALNIFLIDQIIFPHGIGGADASTHLARIIGPIISNGHVPGIDFAYVTFPTHHIYVSVGSLISVVSAESVYYFLGGLVFSTGVLFAFLIGRLLFDEKFGLLAALLFPGSSYIIYWASHPAPITYTAPIILALVLLITYSYRRRNIGMKILVPILIMSIVFSHPYSSVLVILILLSIVITERLLGLQRIHLKWSVGNTFLMFLAVLLVHWIYYSFLFQTAVGFMENYVSTIMTGSLIAQPAVYDSFSISTIFLNTLGLSLVGLFSICGFLFFYSRTSLSRAVIMGIALALASVALVGQMFNFIYVIPHRIFFYLEALAFVFLAAGGIRYLRLDSLKSGISNLRGILVIPLVFLIFFFSASSTVSGFETGLFSEGHPYVKLYETSYERVCVSWMNDHLESNESILIYRSRSFSQVSIDRILLVSESNGSMLEYIPLTESFDDVDFNLIMNNSRILFSTYDIELGFQSGVTGSGRYGLGIYDRFDTFDLLQLGIFDRHFDDGEVIVFSIGA